METKEQTGIEEGEPIPRRLDSVPPTTATPLSKKRQGPPKCGDGAHRGDVSAPGRKSQERKGAFHLGSPSLRPREQVGRESSSPLRRRLERLSKQVEGENASPVGASGDSGGKVSRPSFSTMRPQCDEERRKTEEEKCFPFCHPDIHRSINLNLLCMHTSCDDEDFLLRVALEKVSSTSRRPRPTSRRGRADSVSTLSFRSFCLGARVGCVCRCSSTSCVWSFS